MRLAWQSRGGCAEAGAGIDGSLRGSVALHASSVAPGGGRAEEDGAVGGRCGGRSLVCRTHVGVEVPVAGAETPAVAEADVELLRQTWGGYVAFAFVRVRGGR
eukprot:SAG11_NODE_377_length_9984_cov_74.655438_1_plen_103_part_00